jgi:branched-chain amino acid transport system permease protein
MASWLDYTINGLIVGNIYALLAVGLALIFGVSHLINFAHGSVYMIGGFIGWLCLTHLACLCRLRCWWWRWAAGCWES